MEERLRNLQDFSQIATQLAVEIEVSLPRVEESQRRRDELLQQLLQVVAVMQAEIVRIDETHPQQFSMFGPVPLVRCGLRSIATRALECLLILLVHLISGYLPT